MKVAAALIGMTLAAPAQATLPGSPSAEAPAPRGVKDPLAFVREQYAHYIRATTDPDADIPSVDFAMSAELLALMERDRRESEGRMPRLDFGYWLNAQDIEIKAVKVAETGPARVGVRVIRAKFHNGRPQTIDFVFIGKQGQWELDNVVNAGARAGERWTLREILNDPLP
jgi:hypothetical protein